MTLEDPEMLSNRRAADKGAAPMDVPYVHYSPPRLLDARKWARGGDVERLREAALGGHAHRLLGLAAPGVKTRAFLRDLPKLIAKCEALHLAATEGSLQEIQDILEKDSMRKRLAMCRDRAGVGLLHKAVYYDYRDIITYLLENYPQTTQMRDSEGRTPLHYAAVCSDPSAVSEELIQAGAERNPIDSRQRQPSYYMTRPTALRLPEPPPPTPQQTELVIKPANIRIWCHDRDLGRLQQVVWKGQGARLRTEVSNQPAVKRFLEAVPHIMVTIKDIHTAVIQNDLEKVKELTTDPIPPIVLSSQDLNGLTALHKAAGLGHYEIADYMLDKYPEGTQIIDNDGRTALHWSILAKDKDQIYNDLVEHGAKESTLDNKLKSAAFYKNRPNDLDRSLLMVKPDAPRVASPTYPSSWDWELLKADAQSIIHLTRSKKHSVEKISIPSSESMDLQRIPNHNHEEMKMKEPEPANELEIENGDRESVHSHDEEEHANGDQDFDADGEADDELVEDDLKANDIDENHNDHNDVAENIGEAEKSPTPELSNDNFNDDTSDKPESALSTHEYNQSPNNNAHNISTPVTPDLEVRRNGSVSKPSSAVSRKSSARSYRISSAKSGKSVDGAQEVETDETHHNVGDEDHETNNNNLSEIDHPNEENENKSDNKNEVDEKSGDSDHQDEHEIIHNENETNHNETPNEEIENEINHHETLNQETENEINHNETPNEETENEINHNETPNEETENEINHNETQNQETENELNHDEKHIHENDHSDLKLISNRMDDNDDDSSNQSEEKSEDFKGPHVQDIDDEKGDDPDLEAHVNVARSRPVSNISRKISSAHAHQAELLDVDRNIPSRNGVSGHSQGSESTIEGVINADAEVDSLEADQRISGNSPDEGDVNIDDAEVQTLINTGNMEQLASLVLNGEGERLVGHMARNPDLQAFLDNVPSYMNKIKRVHLSARDGNIRELQAALDRRKFAVARDQVSPDGATPLHVAVLFGHTPIVRYLAGRFPETLSAVDFEGRTALHYAAVLNDNDHYYNILLNMGANPKDNDDNGYTPEDYKNNGNHLTHKQLLKKFGADESMVEEMLADKESAITATNAPGNSESGPNGQVDVPLFRTEEGKYLAMSLGDPLIKGLTEVANIRPKDPIAFLATYLYNFANQNKNTRVGTQESEHMPEVAQVRAAPAMLHPVPPRSAEAVHPHQAAIDAVTSVPPTPGGPEVAFSSENRDEHGQSMLHFAAARGHARGALMQLVREAGVSPSFRDELYRTARDVSIQANMPENTKELDMWVLETAARGELDKLKELLMNGYDHILDIEDDDGAPIAEVVSQRGHAEMGDLFALIPEFEETRERLHQAIRQGDEIAVREIMGVSQRADPIQNLLSGKSMASAKNSFGRCSLHIAVLGQKEEIVEYIAKTFPETLRIGDNLERTALHYAMGVDNVESTSRVLIKAGAKRVLKDLKGRQPSYYFMNKSDILRLKEEEEAY